MRRLTVFCKLAFLWAVIAFSENFTVKAPKCDYDGRTKKQGENEDLETCKMFFSNFLIFGLYFYHESLKVTL